MQLKVCTLSPTFGYGLVTTVMTRTPEELLPDFFMSRRSMCGTSSISPADLIVRYMCRSCDFFGIILCFLRDLVSTLVRSLSFSGLASTSSATICRKVSTLSSGMISSHRR